MRGLVGQFYCNIIEPIYQFSRREVGTYTIESGKKTPIQFPAKDEKMQVASFFAALDRFIVLHQREFAKLQNMKKALLGKMFV